MILEGYQVSVREVRLESRFSNAPDIKLLDNILSTV